MAARRRHPPCPTPQPRRLKARKEHPAVLSGALAVANCPSRGDQSSEKGACLTQLLFQTGPPGSLPSTASGGCTRAVAHSRGATRAHRHSPSQQSRSDQDAPSGGVRRTGPALASTSTATMAPTSRHCVPTTTQSPAGSTPHHACHGSTPAQVIAAVIQSRRYKFRYGYAQVQMCIRARQPLLVPPAEHVESQRLGVPRHVQIVSAGEVWEASESPATGCGSKPTV